MEDKKPAEIEGYLSAAVAAGGRFLSFYFQPCLFAFLLLSVSFGFCVSIFFPCVCVACALWCFPPFVSLPLISPSLPLLALVLSVSRLLSLMV